MKLFLNRKVPVLTGVTLALVGASQMANAALDPAIATTFTGVQSDAAALISLAWPVFAFIAAGFVVFKLVKRVISKF